MLELCVRVLHKKRLAHFWRRCDDNTRFGFPRNFGMDQGINFPLILSCFFPCPVDTSILSTVKSISNQSAIQSIQSWFSRMILIHIFLIAYLEQYLIVDARLVAKPIQCEKLGHKQCSVRFNPTAPSLILSTGRREGNTCWSLSNTTIAACYQGNA